MSTHRGQQITLSPGQSLHLCVRAHTHLVVTHGQVQVHGPVLWLAETLQRHSARLHEGQSHCVAQTGWIEIAALGEARLVHQAPPSAARAALLATWTLLGRWLGQPEAQPGNSH